MSFVLAAIGVGETEAIANSFSTSTANSYEWVSLSFLVLGLRFYLGTYGTSLIVFTASILALAAAYWSLLLIELIINNPEASTSLESTRSTIVLVSESEVDLLFFLSYSAFSADLISCLDRLFLFILVGVGFLSPVTSNI